MNSLVFFTRRKGWKPEIWTTLMGGKVTESGQFVVETSDSWLSVYKYDEVFDDYDESEEQLIRSVIQDPVPYLIEWRGDELLGKFIDNFPIDEEAVIDNDHGLICSISELKGKSIRDWLRKRTVKT